MDASEAEYRAALPDDAFAVTEDLPQAWRRYLQRDSWFRRGWLPSGCYLWLHTPEEGAEILGAFSEYGPATHPGIALIGGDGAREHLVVELGLEDPPVVLVDDLSSVGWAAAIRQAESVSAFIERVDAGTFDFA